MTKQWMLPADINPAKLDFTNPEVVDAIEVLHKEQKYNSYLYEFLENAYPWQRVAMNLSDTNRVIGLICGNQCGKTETAMAIVAMHLTGIYPSWYTGRRFTKPPVIAVAGENANHNRMSLQKKLFGTDNRQIKSEMGTGMIPLEFIIEESVAGDRGTSVKTCKVQHSSGGMSSLEFRAYSDGREAIQGFAADIIVIDEQPPEDFWAEALIRTTATAGLVICSFTPLKGFTGLVDTLWKLPKRVFDSEVRTRQDGLWAMVNAGWLDCKHISDEQIKNLSVGLDESQLKARMYGEPYLGEGRVFPIETSQITFELQGFNIIKDWRHLIALDWGFTRDPAALIYSVFNEETDVLYVTEEWKGHVSSAEEFSKFIWGIHPRAPVAWPRDGGSTGGFKGGDTPAMQMQELGVNLLPKPFLNPRGLDGKKNNHIAPGVTEINGRLQTGRLIINKDCEGLLGEMDKYSYKDGKIAAKQDDHLIDAFRYNVMSQIQFYGDYIHGQKFVDTGFDDEDYHYNVM